LACTKSYQWLSVRVAQARAEARQLLNPEANLRGFKAKQTALHNEISKLTLREGKIKALEQMTPTDVKVKVNDMNALKPRYNSDL
jgi:hypothetical protein